MADPSTSPASEGSNVAPAAGQFSRHALESSLTELVRAEAGAGDASRTSGDSSAPEHTSLPEAMPGPVGRQALAALADEVAHASVAESPVAEDPTDTQPTRPANRRSGTSRARLRSLGGQADAATGGPAGGGDPSQAVEALSPVRPTGRLRTNVDTGAPSLSDPAPGAVKLTPAPTPPAKLSPVRPVPAKLSPGGRSSAAPLPAAASAEQPTIPLRRRPVAVPAPAPEPDVAPPPLAGARTITTVEAWLPSDDDILPRRAARRGRSFRRVR